MHCKIKKARRPIFPSCPEALKALNQGSNLILNFTAWLFLHVANMGASELLTLLEIEQDCWKLGRSLLSSSRTMNLFSYVLCSYLYGSTASVIGLQSGVREFYLPCISAGAPKRAGLWRTSPFRMNPLGDHLIATTCHNLQLAKLKGQRIFHARRDSRVITAEFWLEASWGWRHPGAGCCFILLSG